MISHGTLPPGSFKRFSNPTAAAIHKAQAKRLAPAVRFQALSQSKWQILQQIATEYNLPALPDFAYKEECFVHITLPAKGILSQAKRGNYFVGASN